MAWSEPDKVGRSPRDHGKAFEALDPWSAFDRNDNSPWASLRVDHASQPRESLGYSPLIPTASSSSLMTLR